jgi:hypothetical protein
MSPEKEQLLLKIIDGILSANDYLGPITGDYPNRKCPFCHGKDGGYWDQFDHTESCPYILNEQLKKLDE